MKPPRPSLWPNTNSYKKNDNIHRTSITSLPRLTGADDFIHWRQRVKASLPQNDVDFIGLSYKPDPVTSSQQRRWLQLDAKSKSTIALTFGNGQLARVSATVDDDKKTAKDLWDELGSAYQMSNKQMVSNIQRELEMLTCHHDEE